MPVSPPSHSARVATAGGGLRPAAASTAQRCTHRSGAGGAAVAQHEASGLAGSPQRVPIDSALHWIAQLDLILQKTPTGSSLAAVAAEIGSKAEVPIASMYILKWMRSQVRLSSVVCRLSCCVLRCTSLLKRMRSGAQSSRFRSRDKLPSACAGMRILTRTVARHRAATIAVELLRAVAGFLFQLLSDSFYSSSYHSSSVPVHMAILDKYVRRTESVPWVLHTPSRTVGHAACFPARARPAVRPAAQWRSVPLLLRSLPGGEPRRRH